VTAREVIDWLDNQLGYERPRYTGKASLNIPFPLTATQTDDPPHTPDRNEGDTSEAERIDSDSE
jgi:hypothetical protein